MDERVVWLNEEMTEIVSAAVAQGLGTSADDVVLLALRMLWSHHQNSTHQWREAELQAAAADLHPGKPVEEVFAHVRGRLERVMNAHKANAA